MIKNIARRSLRRMENKVLGMPARKYFEESLLMLAYYIIARAVRIDARIKPLLDTFDHMRSTL